MVTLNLTAYARLQVRPSMPNTRFTTTPLAWCQVVKGT